MLQRISKQFQGLPICADSSMQHRRNMGTTMSRSQPIHPFASVAEDLLKRLSLRTKPSIPLARAKLFEEDRTRIRSAGRLAASMLRFHDLLQRQPSIVPANRALKVTRPPL
jgi:hypothetical protein